jgi:tetratricopeptide (TPR) repeat protein
MMDVSAPDGSSASAEVADTAPSALYEQALTLAAMGCYKEAMKTLRDVTIRAPRHAPAWQKLAELLRLAGKDGEARAASTRAAGLVALWASAKDERTPEEIAAAEQILQEQVAKLATPREKWQWLQDRLRNNATDVAAMRLLACLEENRGAMFAARDLFERVLKLSPSNTRARKDYVTVLRELGRDALVLEQTRQLLAEAPEDIEYRVMHADALRTIGDMEGAIAILERLVRENPTFAKLRCMFARVLRFAGRREQSARECRAALELRPGMGLAFAGLAKLRGDFLTSDDVAAMREHLRNGALDDDNRLWIQFALGQALEQMGDFAGSFAAYEAGAALAKDPAYDLAKDIRDIRRRRAVFTPSTVAKCAPETVSPGTTPIFVVGMPRAGSTLVEQILASHSRVEGTQELPVMTSIVDDLARSRLLVAPKVYPECLTELTPKELSELGARYIHDASAYRKTDRPYFVDKRPWNWLEAGFIRMILPHAKIVDVRRDPMAACFGMFKQDIDAALFSNDFNDLAGYYTEYVSMMGHYERVMPGRIHLVDYRRLVEDTEAEIRRLLDYCGLSFEESCVRFWETDRAVATPSAEQVRRPISREGLDRWKNFEPWLGPLKEALQVASADTALHQPEGYELGLTFAAMGAYEQAIQELQDVVKREPKHAGAWRKLAALLRPAGKNESADEAEAEAARYAEEAGNWRIGRDERMPNQLEAGRRALENSHAGRNRPGQIEDIRQHLAEYPTDASAMYRLAELELLRGDELTALALLERTLELAPLWRAARQEFVSNLINNRELERALEQAEIMARDFGEDATIRTLRADVLEHAGKVSEAQAIIEELLRTQPRNPTLWLRYGMMLRTAGKREESARALRKCLEIEPTLGEAYAGLADLKGAYLTEADIAAMRARLEDPSLEPARRMRMHYALASTLERAGDFGASFASYESAARLIRGSFLGRGEAYNEKRDVERVRDYKHFFTKSVLSRPQDPAAASPAVTPILVVGMPRAGSTLTEQILGSHSKVEATRELPLVAEIVRELSLGRRHGNRNAYPECLRDMTGSQLAELGQRYIERARRYRQTDLPYFVDKRPWNWLDAGLVHMILPQAKIIDIRREPMAACFAMYKQQLPRDAAFSYDQVDLGHYYNLYVSLMEHWKAVMPGRIHFVQYEGLVEDTENEIRRMLDYCGLPFEEGCLRFWETDRAVSTPSAEQVRRPIYRDAVEQWRNFEPWLGPLKAALAEPPPA